LKGAADKSVIVYSLQTLKEEVVMNAWSRFAAVAMAGCLSTLVAGAVGNAAEITIVASGGPLPDVMGTLLPMFESATGNKVKVSFKGGPAITADVKQGAADLVVTNTEVVDELAAGGDVVSNGKTLLMISKVGVAVKAGAPKPDISTPDKLKAALLAAKTVGYSQGASGQHFLTVIQKLGIADAIKAKAVIAQGRPVGAAIASGEAEIGVQQVAELRPVPGTEVIGEMPADLQKQIPYSAGIATKAKDAETARAGELPAVRSGARSTQAQGHGRALISRSGAAARGDTRRPRRKTQARRQRWSPGCSGNAPKQRRSCHELGVGPAQGTNRAELFHSPNTYNTVALR
jgi:molybdate transport system substrate-binding protein